MSITDILITPKLGNILHTSTGAPSAITLNWDNSTGTLVWDGSAGSLFSIEDSLTGSLLSVSDISGLPIFEVFDTDRIIMGTFGNNTLVVDASRVAINQDSGIEALDVSGNILIKTLGDKLMFGDSGTAISRSLSTEFTFNINSSDPWKMSTDEFFSNATNGPKLRRDPTSSNVAYGFVGDTNTGLNWNSVDNFSLMTGGIPAITINPTQDVSIVGILEGTSFNFTTGSIRFGFNGFDAWLSRSNGAKFYVGTGAGQTTVPSEGLLLEWLANVNSAHLGTTTGRFISYTDAALDIGVKSGVAMRINTAQDVSLSYNLTIEDGSISINNGNLDVSGNFYVGGDASLRSKLYLQTPPIDSSSNNILVWNASTNEIEQTQISLKRVVLKTTIVSDLGVTPWTEINWDSEYYIDTDIFTHDGSIITVNEAGVYRVSATIGWTSNQTSNRSTILVTNRINGIVRTQSIGRSYNRGTLYGLSTSYTNSTVSLEPGDTIEIVTTYQGTNYINNIIVTDSEFTVEKISSATISNTWRPITDTPGPDSGTSISAQWALEYTVSISGTPANTYVAYFSPDGSTITGNSSLSYNGSTLTGTNMLATTFTNTTTSTRDKYRLYNSNVFAIGAQSAVTYGGLGDWATTFTMLTGGGNRGWWWGETSDTVAQGAMALNEFGQLTVADSIRIGYGKTDTIVPGVNYTLDTSGAIHASTMSLDVNLTLGDPNAVGTNRTINTTALSGNSSLQINSFGALGNISIGGTTRTSDVNNILQLNANFSSLNTTSTIADFFRTSSGVPTDGIGGRINFYIEGNPTYGYSSLRTLNQDVVNGYSDFEIWVRGSSGDRKAINVGYQEILMYNIAGSTVGFDFNRADLTTTFTPGGMTVEMRSDDISITNGHFLLSEIGAPATDSSGYGRLYADSVDSKLKWRDDTGNIYDLTSGTGAFSSDINTLITPTTPIVLDNGTVVESALSLDYTVNKASGITNGLNINMTDTLSGSSAYLINGIVDGVSKFSVNNLGVIYANTILFENTGYAKISSNVGTILLDAEGIGGSPPFGVFSFANNGVTFAFGEIGIGDLSTQLLKIEGNDGGLNASTAIRQYGIFLVSDVSQTSAALGYTGIGVNITELSTIGTNYLMNLEVGSVSKFNILNTGEISVNTTADSSSLLHIVDGSGIPYQSPTRNALNITKDSSGTAGVVITNEFGESHTWFNYIDGANYITGDETDTGGFTRFRGWTGSVYIDYMTIKKGGHIAIDRGILKNIKSVSSSTTLLDSDNGKTVECDGTLTLTMPSTPEIGWNVDVINIGTGVITIAGGTINAKGTKLASQWIAATIYHKASNIFRAFGDLTT